MNKKVAPKSPVFTNCLKAFLIGGGICTLAEVIVQLVQTYTNIEQKEARLIGSISLIFLSILLTGLNVYDNIAKHAGAAPSCPLPASPTPSRLRPSSSRRKVLSWAWRPKCSPLPGRCWYTASPRPSRMD